jgi:hypothetical protein
METGQLKDIFVLRQLLQRMAQNVFPLERYSKEKIEQKDKILCEIFIHVYGSGWIRWNEGVAR